MFLDYSHAAKVQDMLEVLSRQVSMVSAVPRCVLSICAYNSILSKSSGTMTWPLKADEASAV